MGPACGTAPRALQILVLAGVGVAFLVLLRPRFLLAYLSYPSALARTVLPVLWVPAPFPAGTPAWLWFVGLGNLAGLALIIWLHLRARASPRAQD